MSSTLPRIAITMGDPAGVGPEVCLRLLQNEEVRALCVPVIFGDADILRRCSETIGVGVAADFLPEAASSRLAEISRPAVLDLPIFDRAGFLPGTISAATGAAAYHYVERSIDAALAGTIQGITTAPLNKEAMHMAGIRFPGHTEIFAARTHSERACMLQYSEEVRASFVTVHVGYAEVPALLTVERILDVVELTRVAMQRLRTPTPHLAILGLNPHAGEHGLFGNREEERIIIPAIDEARRRGYSVEGPLPPDTAFLPWKRRAVDAFICMYHDQGHIPLKALAFDSAVNTTLGLPIIRTSVDHGTACDIAWQGKANPGSLIEAVKMAARLAH